MDRNHPVARGEALDHRRPFGRYLVIALFILLTPIFVLGATIAATGTVTVKVREKSPDGVDLFIPVPALLFDVVVFLAPLMMPDEALSEIREEIEPWQPALEAVAEEMENCPSGVLVEVHSGKEHVRVYKEWRSFHVDVDNPEADVQVAIPARLLSRALDVLG